MYETNSVGEDLLTLDVNYHLSQLQELGYTLIPDFLTREESNELINHLETLEVQKFNTNELGGQYSGHGYFEQRLTAKSRLIYKILLNESLHGIFRGFFSGHNYRVISTRLYRITGGFRYSFHTDNKKEANKTKTNGLACLVYLNDTKDGALQVYEMSHKDSDEVTSNTVKSDFLDARYGSNMRKHLPGKAGTLVLCNIRTFHGSKQEDTNLRAYRLWFQVNDDLDMGERILIDPSLIDKPLSQEQMTFLGFGLPNIGKAYPLSSFKTAPTSIFWGNLASLLVAAPASIKARLKAVAIARFRNH